MVIRWLAIFLVSICLQEPLQATIFTPATKEKSFYEPGIGAYSLSIQLAALSALKRGDKNKFVEISRKGINAFVQIGKRAQVIIPEEADISSVFDIDDPDIQGFKNEHNKRNEAVKNELERIERVKKETGSDKVEPNLEDLQRRSQNMVAWSKAIYKKFVLPEIPYAKGTAKAMASSKFKRLVRFLGPNAKKFFVQGSKIGAYGEKITKLTKLGKWSKSFFGKGGAPLMDVLTLGLSIKSLSTAIQKKDTPGIIMASIGIFASTFSIGTFLLASAFSSLAFLGPIGPAVGLLLCVVNGLIAYFTKTEDMELFNRKLAALRKVKKASIEELDFVYKYLQEINKAGFRDVYVANQGSLLYDNSMADLKDVPVTFGHKSGNFRMSLTERKPLSDERNSEFDNKTLIPQGYYRKFKDPKGNSHDFGFDFYGLHQNKPYNGAAVLVYTDMILNANNFKSVHISTDISDGGDMNDQIVFGAYNKIKDERKVRISTGAGNDVLNIDGYIGGRLYGNTWSDFEYLKADLGDGDNVLNLQGTPMPFYYTDNRGRSVDSMMRENVVHYLRFDYSSGTLSYMPGALDTLQLDHKVKVLGTVKNVKIFQGSDLIDLILLGDSSKTTHDFDENEEVMMSQGTELDHFTVIEFNGPNFYVIDLRHIKPEIRTEFTIIDMSDKPAYVSIMFDDTKENLGEEHLVYKGFTLFIYREVGGERKPNVRVYMRCKKKPLFSIQYVDEYGQLDKGWNAEKARRQQEFFSYQWAVFFKWYNNGFYEELLHGIFRDMYENLPPVYLGKNGRKISLMQTGSGNTDLLTMTCEEEVTKHTDMLGGVDYIQISDNFLDSCIHEDPKDSSKNEEMRLTKKDESTIEFSISNKSPKRSGFDKAVVKNAEVIINEYGYKVFDIRTLEVGQSVDIEEKYYEKTRKALGINEWVDGEKGQEAEEGA